MLQSIRREVHKGEPRSLRPCHWGRYRNRTPLQLFIDSIKRVPELLAFVLEFFDRGFYLVVLARFERRSSGGCALLS
jgi:hypothetical protein